jgi:aminomethyltransferase
MRWKDWGGYYSTLSYENQHDAEYAAIRYSAGLMDVTPLFKYEVYGPDAGHFLNRIIAKNIKALKLGQTTYCCWTDHFGKVLDDGTVTRLREDYFRVTAAEPCFHWFKTFERGHRVTIEDSTDTIGTLALQGPRSREILLQLFGSEVGELKFFRAVETKLDGIDVTVTRTGYTGDLGYEIWVKNDSALKVYDAISSVGQNYSLVPFGLDALDIARVEAGFIMNGVDYFSANHCMTESRKSTPYELGLGWTVNLENRDPFIGQEALRKMKKEGSKWSFVGLVLDWDEQEHLFAKYDLPPQICGHAWRDAVPIYNGSGKQVGQATSGAWSPILKLNLALATVETSSASLGEDLYIEYTVEYVRHRVKAKVTKTPFFNPERKRQSKWP